MSDNLSQEQLSELYSTEFSSEDSSSEGKLVIELAPANFRTCIYCHERKLKTEFAWKKLTCIVCTNDPSNYARVCTTCGEEKTGKEFSGTRTKCRDCTNAETRAKEKSKICTVCNEYKLGDSFKAKHKICIDCEEDPTIDYELECTTCGDSKSARFFKANSLTCVDCEQARGRNYRQTDVGKEKAKTWSANNSERDKELKHNNYIETKEKRQAHNKERYTNEPLYQTKQKSKSTIKTMIKGSQNKPNYSSDLLRVSRYQFTEWLIFQFTDEMTMDNYGEVWTTDHVIPLDILNHRTFANICFSEECDLSVVYGWYNIMPFPAKSNLTKNKYFDRKQLVTHIARLRKFVRSNKKSLSLDVGKHYNNYLNIIQKISDEGVEVRTQVVPKRKYDKTYRLKTAKTKITIVITDDILYNIMLQANEPYDLGALFLVKKATVDFFNSSRFWLQKYAALPFYPCHSIDIESENRFASYTEKYKVHNNPVTKIWEMLAVSESYKIAKKFCQLSNKKKLKREGGGYWVNSVDTCVDDVYGDSFNMFSVNCLGPNLLKMLSDKISKFNSELQDNSEPFDVSGGDILFTVAKEDGIEKRSYIINFNASDYNSEIELSFDIILTRREFTIYLAKLIYWSSELFNLNVCTGSDMFNFNPKQFSEFLSKKRL